MKRLLFISLILAIMASPVVFAAQRKPAPRRPTTIVTLCGFNAAEAAYWVATGPITCDNGCFNFDGQRCKDDQGSPFVRNYQPVPAVTAHYRITGTVIVEEAH